MDQSQVITDLSNNVSKNVLAIQTRTKDQLTLPEEGQRK
jgi:hypothetical protein